MNERPAEEVTEETLEPNVFKRPTEQDFELLAQMSPMAHQFLHSIRFLLEERDSEEPVTPEMVVYYALTVASLISTSCQGIDSAALNTVISKVSDQYKAVSEEFAFPTPIGNA